LFDVRAGKLSAELLQRLLAQRRRDFIGEELHTFARQVVGHVAELKLNQQIADLGFLDQRTTESGSPGSGVLLPPLLGAVEKGNGRLFCNRARMDNREKCQKFVWLRCKGNPWRDSRGRRLRSFEQQRVVSLCSDDHKCR
jgi:hypothetical protein